MDLGLAGKVGIVAAASKGLGKAVAMRFAQEGMKVAICARDAGTLNATAQEIARRTGAEVLPIRADVTRYDEIKNLVAETVRRFGGLDVLVTNAGGPPPGNFFACDDSAWEQAFQLTLMSVVRLCREAIPHMQKRGGGRIINISSVSVKQPIDNLILSNSLRLAVVGLAKSLANELAPMKITVNTVCPGPTQTERMEQLSARWATLRKPDASGRKTSRWGGWASPRSSPILSRSWPQKTRATSPERSSK
jgi:3-oxoacyl-[acyl-carrier protein] reductase